MVIAMYMTKKPMPNAGGPMRMRIMGMSMIANQPRLSLPSMLVIRSVMGTQKTIVFVLLVISMATISGIIFGAFF